MHGRFGVAYSGCRVDLVRARPTFQCVHECLQERTRIFVQSDNNEDDGDVDGDEDAFDSRTLVKQRSLHREATFHYFLTGSASDIHICVSLSRPCQRLRAWSENGENSALTLSQAVPLSDRDQYRSSYRHLELEFCRRKFINTGDACLRYSRKVCFFGVRKTRRSVCQ